MPLVLVLSLAASLDASTHPEIAEIHIDSAKLSRIDANSAEFELAVSGIARKSVTIKSIFFQQVLVNGIAIRLPAIEGPLKLQEGQEIRNLPVLTALAPFREVPSLAPLREIVGEGAAHIHAVALVQLELNLLQMFALRSTNVWAATNIDQDVSIELPGGILGRAAALAALTAAEPVWVLGNAGREWRLNRSVFASQAEEALKNFTVPIECSYEIRSHNGETRILRSRSLGFILPSGRILTTAEAVEPWAFDSAMQEAMAHHEISITEDSVEIIASPPGQGPAYSSKRNELKVVQRRAGKEHMISGRNKTSYRLRFRDADDNAVLLELKGFQPPEKPLRKSAGRDGEWQSAAVLRTDLDAQTAPYVWITEVRRENARWVLKDPAGVTALGSPVWTEDGVAGILQNDGSGAMIENVLRSFPVELF